jgi:sphinganine-1-phosphate aldolase
MSRLPVEGLSRDAVVAELTRLRAGDADWRSGRVFALVYDAGEDLRELADTAASMFLAENAFNTDVFPSLRRMQGDIVAMTAGLLGGDDDVVGVLTSGGTESILLAVKAARDRAARDRGITVPNVVLPASAHPAFNKAGHYLGVRCVRVPVAEDWRADVAAMAAAVDADTVLLVGSAPSYPQGMVDPIAELAAVAEQHGVGFHVDACMGGFVLPFLGRSGYAVAPFDFAVPGVTSMSADLHKYGYAVKGASVSLFRTRDLRDHVVWEFDEWLGGRYGSATMLGSRSGAPIAAAWAVLHCLGERGYTQLAVTAKQAAERLVAGIESIPGLVVLGKPDATLLAFASTEFDVFAIADMLRADGWVFDRQSPPDSLHATVTAAHPPVVDEVLGALTHATTTVGNRSASRSFSYGTVD